MPLLLGGWFLGVMIFGMRLLGGVGTVVWCRWSSLPITDPSCLQLLERLSHQLGMSRPPRLAASFRAGDAFSLGLFRPLIVLPAAWLLELPPETLESVLAHELAHIRRWDAWANLFQRVLEAWLFYHPAVWWLSRQMDREREKCADLGAVSLTGDPLQYVKALAGVAELQSANRPAKFFGPGPILATGMGGKNMVLLERVRHILGDTPRTGAASRLLAGALALAIPAALWVGTMMLPVKAADDDGKLIAQADEDEKGETVARDGDPGRARKAKRPRDRDRTRRRTARRDGDRPEQEGDREGRRDGDRPRREGPRDGDRPRGEGPRDGDRPRGEGPRRPPRISAAIFERAKARGKASGRAAGKAISGPARKGNCSKPSANSATKWSNSARKSANSAKPAAARKVTVFAPNGKANAPASALNAATSDVPSAPSAKANAAKGPSGNAKANAAKGRSGNENAKANAAKERAEREGERREGAEREREGDRGTPRKSP